MEQTRSDMRNPFVDTEGLAVMSQHTYTAGRIFFLLFPNITQDAFLDEEEEEKEEKKGCSDFLSRSAQQNRFRWRRVNIDGEKSLSLSWLFAISVCE